MNRKQQYRVGKVRHTGYAPLAAIGCKLREMDLLSPIKKWVKINQKTVKRSPFEKLQDVLITILAGANGVVEINEILRVDETLQRAFGRKECAEQSVVQLTLNKCTPQNVGEMMKAMDEIFRNHSHTFRHDFRAKPLMLDIDMTGLPCGKKAEEALKGYQANLGIRYGRQMCRVSSADYEEVVVDRIYPGNVHFSLVIPWMVDDVTETLRLSEENRERTVIRMDAGGGAQIDLILSKGYQIHSKEYSSKRAEGFALAVKHWVPDPNHPRRELGWLNTDLKDFCRPVKRLIMRWKPMSEGK